MGWFNPSKRLSKLILAHLRNMKWSITLAIVSLLGVTLTELLRPWPLKLIIDQLLLDQPFREGLNFLTASCLRMG